MGKDHYVRPWPCFSWHGRLGVLCSLLRARRPYNYAKQQGEGDNLLLSRTPRNIRLFKCQDKSPTTTYEQDKKMMWIFFAILCSLSAFFYRRGGTSAGTLWRDLGTSACLILAFPILHLVHGLWEWLSLILVWAITYGALTTYRYFLPKPTDYNCWYYGLHGFMVAFADIPFAWVTGKWISLGIRCIACSLLVGSWSGLISNDDLEEGGRGFILCVTRLFYLLPF